jgi:hypothetical protein
MRLPTSMLTRFTVLVRSVGGTIGITLASAAYQNTLKEGLWDRFGELPTGPEEIRRILDGLEELKRLPGGWGEGVIASFMESFRLVWVMMVFWAFLALVCIAMLKQHKLHVTMDRA